MRAPLPRLLVVMDRAATTSPTLDGLLEVFAQACAGGARLFWWRDRGAGSDGEYWEGLQEASKIAAGWGARVLVRNRADMMWALALDGVHCSGDGLPVAVVRRLVRQGEGLVSVTAHTAKEAGGVGGADLVVLGPIYPTASKPGYGPALGTEALSQVKIPGKLFALGGLTPALVAPCLEAGAYGVAVMGGICHAEDPFEATLAYHEALGAGTTG